MKNKQFKFLLTMVLLSLSSTVLYGASALGGFSDSSGSDGTPGALNNERYNPVVDEEPTGSTVDFNDKTKSSNTVKQNTSDSGAIPQPTGNAATNSKPESTASKSSETTERKIQKTTKEGQVSYSWAPPQETAVASDGTKIELIDVAVSSLGNSSDSVGIQSKQSLWANQFTMFPQDNNGWSIIKPQVDSRIIYVSSSDGNDLKARAYFSKDIDNPHNPSKKIVAFKTINKAVELVRDGYPDWVLLKKGDEWQLEQGMYLPSGKSSSAPLVITSYGLSEKRPLIKTGTHSGFSLAKFRSYVAIMGLEFYANQRDPNSTDFVGWDNAKSPTGFRSVAIPGADSIGKKVESIHLEDNIFNFFAAGIVIDGQFPQEDIIIRRNQILNSYSVSSHGQGMYTSTSSILLEDNLFDHNGWYKQNYGSYNSQKEGQATIYNHSIYTSNIFNTIMVGNIFSRSSSIGIKMTSNSDSGKNTVKVENIVLKDNLFLEGEIGISAGGNQDFNNGFRWRNFSIIENVMLHVGKAQPTRRTLAWHIDVQDWDGGLVDNNHLLYNDNPNVTDVAGIAVTGFTRNVSVTNNVVRGLGGDAARMIYKLENETLTNITMSQNVVSADTPVRLDLITYFNLNTTGNGVTQLVEKARTQSKGNWNKSYTATEINRYLRGE